MPSLCNGAGPRRQRACSQAWATAAACSEERFGGGPAHPPTRALGSGACPAASGSPAACQPPARRGAVAPRVDKAAASVHGSHGGCRALCRCPPAGSRAPRGRRCRVCAAAPGCGLPSLAAEQPVLPARRNRRPAGGSGSAGPGGAAPRPGALVSGGAPAFAAASRRRQQRAGGWRFRKHQARQGALYWLQMELQQGQLLAWPVAGGVVLPEGQLHPIPVFPLPLTHTRSGPPANIPGPPSAGPCSTAFPTAVPLSWHSSTMQALEAAPRPQQQQQRRQRRTPSRKPPRRRLGLLLTLRQQQTWCLPRLKAVLWRWYGLAWAGRC